MPRCLNRSTEVVELAILHGVDKFSEDLRLLPVGTFQPTTVYALLRKLKLTAASREVQATAIDEWLAEHPPGPLMTYTLRKEGFR